MLDEIKQSLHLLSMDELHELNKAVVQQIRLERSVASVQAIRSLKVGDEGKLVNLRGKYNGLDVRVEEIRRSKVVVNIFGSMRRVVVPANCVQVG
jgi:transcription antitermination factor NusG